MEALAALLAESRGFFAVLAGFFGLLVGSFLNVVIHRLPRMMEREWRADCAALAGSDATAVPEAAYNLVTPRSACPSCRAPITAAQNVPVVSWLLLGGKCARCGTGISIRYPVVELLTAGLSVLIALRFGYGFAAMAALGITYVLIALTGIDLDEQLLPDSLTLPMLWAGLVASVLVGHGAAGLPVDPRSAILGAAFGYLSLWTVFQLFRLATGKEGMGFGDYKLFAAFGAWLGWQMLVPIILFSAAAGAVIGIALILARRHGRDAPMPFGPYLAVAGWLVMMYPAELVFSWWPIAR